MMALSIYLVKKGEMRFLLFYKAINAMLIPSQAFVVFISGVDNETRPSLWQWGDRVIER